MRYWVCTFIGLAICLVSLVAVSWALYHLVRIGTCASGGPYVSARPCPEGTAAKILALTGGIFGCLIGLGVYATRGGAGGGTIGAGTLMWSLLFLCLGGAALVGAFGPAADDRADSKTGAIIVAAIFIPMGVLPLIALVGFGGVRRRFAGGDSGLAVPRVRTTITRPPAAAPPAPTSAPGDDPLDRIQKLGELRDAGLLSDEEFDAKKREILREI